MGVKNNLDRVALFLPLSLINQDEELWKTWGTRIRVRKVRGVRWNASCAIDPPPDNTEGLLPFELGKTSITTRFPMID